MSPSKKPVIEVVGVSKDFKLYAHPRQILSEVFLGAAIPVFNALTDISFAVGPGEVVGIMGRNGAGKSTLLRIITGTLNASAGAVRMNGRVSAILELGSGFNADYTGRENIVAGGICMGMSHGEVMRKMDSIIKFSELAEFIDQPFKTYSSGMQTRLTFATAISVDPEILIVDEALSVGDARFQAKCFSRIQEFRDAGKSILLVTHADNVISQFCDRALLLERGRLVMDDKPLKVINTYSDLIYGKGESLREQLLQDAINRAGEKRPGSFGEEPETVEAAGAGKGHAVAADVGPRLPVDRQEPARASPVRRDDDGGAIPPGKSEKAASGSAAPEHLNMFPVRRDADGNVIPLGEGERAALRSAALERLNMRPFSSEGVSERLGDRHKAEILEAYAIDADGGRVSRFTTGGEYCFVLSVLFYEPVRKFVAGCQIRTSKGLIIYGTTTAIQRDGNPDFTGAERGDVVRIRGHAALLNLTNDTFLLTYAVADDSKGDSVIMDGVCDYLLLPFGHDASLYDCAIVDLGVRFTAERIISSNDRFFE